MFTFWKCPCSKECRWHRDRVEMTWLKFTPHFPQCLWPDWNLHLISNSIYDLTEIYTSFPTVFMTWLKFTPHFPQYLWPDWNLHLISHSISLPSSELSSYCLATSVYQSTTICIIVHTKYKQLTSQLALFLSFSSSSPYHRHTSNTNRCNLPCIPYRGITISNYGYRHHHILSSK